MPKRNQQLNSNQQYWIYQENGKGYTVYSKQQLDKMIEEGRIKDTDRVGVRLAYGAE